MGANTLHSDGRKLGINGFGRIGKLTLWHHVGRKYFDEIIVNIGRQPGTGLGDIAHYLERDSTYGWLHGYLYGHGGQPVVEDLLGRTLDFRPRLLLTGRFGGRTVPLLASAAYGGGRREKQRGQDRQRERAQDPGELRAEEQRLLTGEEPPAEEEAAPEEGGEAAPAAAFLLCLWGNPRSPRWLVRKGNDNEAIAVMQRVGGKEYAEASYKEIKQHLNVVQKKGTLAGLFSREMSFIMFIAVIASMVQLVEMII